MRTHTRTINAVQLIFQFCAIIHRFINFSSAIVTSLGIGQPYELSRKIA